MYITLELVDRFVDEKEIMKTLKAAYYEHGRLGPAVATLEIAGERIPLRFSGDASETHEIHYKTARYTLIR